MNQQTITTGKIVLSVIWIGLGSTFFVSGDSTTLTLARFGFWGMLGVHVVECGVFMGAMRASSRPLAGQIVQVLLFGVLHNASLKLDAAQTASDPTSV